jgi:hypothetical protein
MDYPFALVQEINFTAISQSTGTWAILMQQKKPPEGGLKVW